MGACAPLFHPRRVRYPEGPSCGARQCVPPPSPRYSGRASRSNSRASTGCISTSMSRSSRARVWSARFSATTAGRSIPPRCCFGRSMRRSSARWNASPRHTKSRSSRFGRESARITWRRRRWPLSRRLVARDGLLFVGKAQEKTPVIRTEKRHNPRTGRPYPWLVWSTAIVNHWCSYGVDRDFGPFFLKVCSHFPYTVKACLNGTSPSSAS